jgi:hypothetical protein|nr:MAG TPA: hypothetical protein [Caudoviricetes sp.]
MFDAVVFMSFLSTGIRSFSKAFNVISLEMVVIKSGSIISTVRVPPFRDTRHGSACITSIGENGRGRNEINKGRRNSQWKQEGGTKSGIYSKDINYLFYDRDVFGNYMPWWKERR